MHRRSLLALGLAAAATPALAKPRWRTLLDGRSLAGWTPVGEANWRIEDAAAVADTGMGFLVSEEDFGDVAVRAQFWVSDDANSGVFIRCTDPRTIAVETIWSSVSRSPSTVASTSANSRSSPGRRRRSATTSRRYRWNAPAASFDARCCSSDGSGSYIRTVASDHPRTTISSDGGTPISEQMMPSEKCWA